MEDGERHLVRFVLETAWENLPGEVRLQTVMCAVDLFGVLVAGSRTPVAEVGRRMAMQFFPGSAASIFMTGAKASVPGAALANGFAANALDLDDGHRLVKGHPGAVVFPALTAAAEFRNVRLQDFLAALVTAYEVALRAGFVMQEHYDYYHSSGAWGAVGGAAGVAKLLGFDDDRIVQAVATADFHAPMVPVMRSVRSPAMSKDGVGWGSMAGTLAALMAGEGFAGGPSLFACREGGARMMNLGRVYEIMNIYFKPHACCRWAHPAIDAVIDLRRAHGLRPRDVKTIRIATFNAAAELYREKPCNTEQAQYNIVYPTAAAMAEGRVGPREVMGQALRDPEILSLMDRVEIYAEARFEREFPARRLCEVEIVLTSGKTLESGIYDPDRVRDCPVSLPWIIDKFHIITENLLPRDRANELISLITVPEANPAFAELIELVGAE